MKSLETWGPWRRPPTCTSDEYFPPSVEWVYRWSSWDFYSLGRDREAMGGGENKIRDTQWLVWSDMAVILSISSGIYWTAPGASTDICVWELNCFVTLGWHSLAPRSPVDLLSIYCTHKLNTDRFDFSSDRPLTSYVTVGELPNFSEFPFPRLYNEMVLDNPENPFLSCMGSASVFCALIPHSSPTYFLIVQICVM